MKILKVEFENINSLAGKWCIDFTDPSYSELDHSLFVISGKTGVGKTSILDAITLALYGKTPRQGLVFKGGNGNAVMTSDKGSCFARVTYQCKKGIFVSEWSQQRARCKPNGNLQDASGRIYPLNNPEELLFDGNTGNSGQLAKVNEEIIQLGFEQFCRSIMLAQGEFNKFLMCSEKDRAEILEKLNGTEKYRRIAQKVGNHKSDARKIKDLAQNSFDELSKSMPKAEDIEADKEFLKDFAEKEKVLQTQKTELDAKIKWRESLEKASKGVEEAITELEKAKKEKSNFATCEERLAFAEKARDCAPLHTELEGFRKQQKDLENNLNHLQKELPESEKKLNKAKLLQETAAKEKSAAEQFITNNENLWNEVRKLDVNINNAKSEMEEAKSRKEKVSINFENAKKQWEQIKKEIENLEPKVQKLTNFLEKNKKDVELRNVIPQSEAIVKEFRKLESNLIEENKAVKTALKDFEIAESNYQELFKEKQELLSEQQKLFENEVLVLADVIQKHLEEGVPCPVCGSIEHPACKEIADVSEKKSSVQNVAEKIQELNGKMQRVDSNLNQVESKKNLAKSAENLAKERILSLTNEKGEKVKELTELLKPWKEFNAEKIGEILNELKELLKLFEENQKEYSDLSQKLELARNNEKNYKEQEKQFKENLDAEMSKFNESVSKFQKLCNTRKEKFGEKDVEKESSEATHKKNSATTAYENADKNFRGAENIFNEQKTKISALKESIQKTLGNLETALTNFKNAISVKGFADEISYVKATMEESEFRELQNKKKSIDESLASASRLYQEALSTLEKIKAESSDNTPLQVLQIEKKTVEENLNELLKNSGAVKERVEIYQQNLIKLQELEKNLNEKKFEYFRWEAVYELLGKNEGKDFSAFVQGLTFKSLLKLANKHLETIKDRFRLVAKGNLDFEVEDAEFAQNRRISNLSGGEKFLVSLALALGIADFASRNVRVESLFMDEGFGTLDDTTLEDVMTCLRNQQQEGKMLGIITHVESVVNSISQKIQLESVKNGHSIIKGPGVSQVVV